MKRWFARWLLIFLVCYCVWWAAEGVTAWGQNESIRCELGYDPLTHLCIDRTSNGGDSPCSGWSPPFFCWRRETVTEKRNQYGLNEREKAETEQMEAAGFEWNPATNGAPRWNRWDLQLTALREHWMRDVDWDKHRAARIAEAAKLRRFKELPLGTRFRWQRHVDTRRRVYVKLDVDMVIEWKGPAAPDKLQNPIPTSDLSAVDRQVVELFEPFADLMPGELEKLPGFPEVWTALADWHAWQSTEAEAMDCRESSQWHDGRETACKLKAKELHDKRENG